jgi:integrase
VNENAAAAVEMPSEPDYDADPFDSWAEVRRTMDAAPNERDRALILFACATGFRPQEWLALRWQDLDLDGGTVTIHRTVQARRITEGKGKTRRALRTVYLNRYAREALAMLPTQLRRDQLVFPGVRGGIIDLAKWRRGPWRRALKSAGLEYRPPSGMRDTFVTLLLEEGTPLEWISKQMGHSSTTTTERHYSRWTRRGEEAVLARLNERLDSFWTVEVSEGADSEVEKQAASPLGY